MRVNVYHEELTNEVKTVTVVRGGRTFYGVRLFFKSPPALHSTPEDDDRSAVTIWTGTRTDAITYFENALRALRAGA